MARTSLIPGFRFHPTDVELVMFYLKRKLLGKKITVDAVAEVNIYDFSPWDLPDKSSLKSGDLEYYFFCPKSKKYSSGSRSNRSTEAGFWKATGKDRIVKYNERTVATIKTLVFHIGHAGRGQRTDWVMHEYKMEDEHLANAGTVQDAYVLCKVFQKSGAGPKNGAHYGAPFNDEEWGDGVASCIDSQAVVGASNTMDNTQKGSAASSMTEPGSSVVTFSSNQPTITPNEKQDGPTATNMTEPGSSVVTFSADRPTTPLNDKQKGPASMDLLVPQTTHNDVMSFEDLDLPDDDDGVIFSDDIMFSDDVMFFEDIDLIMGLEEDEAAKVDKVKNIVSNEDNGIYDDLVNLVDLEDVKEVDFKTVGADYTLDNLLTLDDLEVDLGEFYVD